MRTPMVDGSRALWPVPDRQLDGPGRNESRMNGPTFVKAARSRAELRDGSLTLVTTETDLQNMARARVAGADEHVIKPRTDEVVVGELTLLGLVGV